MEAALTPPSDHSWANPRFSTRPAWRRQHLERLEREREARRVALEYKREQRSEPDSKPCTKCGVVLPICAFTLLKTGVHAGLRKARCKCCLSADKKAAYKPRTAGAEARQRAAARKVERLGAVLNGIDPTRRVATEDDWDMTVSELRRLWLISGDKTCAACHSVVPASEMVPPGPGNFYPGKCGPCAIAEYRANLVRVGCAPAEGPPPVRLRDGTMITVGEFARRHRERNSRYRIPRWAERPNLVAA